MKLSHDERRAMLAMCCEVARADGTVCAGEYERLLGLLASVGEGAVGFSELEGWLERGPPVLPVRIAGEHARSFVRQALGLARADGRVDEAELSAIKELATRYFDVA